MPTLALAAALFGCAEVPESGSIVVHDSAGVEIVENAGRQGGQVVVEPLLSIGGEDRPREALFDRIRSVARLASGSLLVADGGAHEIRVFSESGDLEITMGREGEGPGEFQRLGSVRVSSGDSIIAYDRRQHRLSVFDSRGTLLEVRPLPRETGGEWIGRFSDGSYLFTNPSILSPGDGTEGLTRVLRHYVRYDPGLDDIDTLLSVPGNEFDVVRNEERSTWVTYEVPFGRDAAHTMGPDSWYVGINDRFRVDHRRPDGSLVRSIRYAPGETTLTSRHVSELEEETIREIAPSPERLRSIRRLFRDVPAPALRPAFSTLVAGRSGRLWVGEWRSSFGAVHAGERRWWVFGDQGRLLGSLDLPASFEIHDAGRDWLLGVDTDELGVESILFMRLELP